MKISSIKEILETYDKNSGMGRSLIDETHIRELREFHAKLPQVDRDLTPKELHKVVLIGLGKKSNNGSASCVAFDRLFSLLGEKKIYSFLQKERCLNEDSVLFVSNQRNNPHALDLIYMLIRHKQYQFLPDLYQLKEQALKPLFDNLTLLEKENESLVTEGNIAALLQIAASAEALINLGHFLSTLSTIKQVQQKQLDHLFQHAERLQKGTNFQRVFDYIFAASWNMLDYIHLVLANCGPEMGNVLGMMEKMGHLSDRQKELLFDTTLRNPQCYDRIVTGLNLLSKGNVDFFETVLSQPEYADKIATGLQVLTTAAPSPKVKGHYANWVRHCAKDIDDLVILVKFLEAHKLCNPNNVSRFLSINLHIKSPFLIAQKLWFAEILCQDNITLLLDKATSKNLGSLLQKCTILAEYCQLNQKNYEYLLDHPEMELSKLQSIDDSGDSMGIADLFVVGLSFWGSKSGKDVGSDITFNPGSPTL